MFTQRLNELFGLLGASNVEVAYFAGVDRSSISRMRNGSRIPRPTGGAAAKLINGLFLCADEKNLTDKLISAVSCPVADQAPDEIRRYILLYLYEGYDDQTERERDNRKKEKKELFRSYGAKLDAAMNLAEISNVRLSRILHVDASAISRFRNGVRVPKANQQLAVDISDILFERIRERDHIAELLKLAGITADIADDKAECRERFRSWLCDFKTDSSSELVEKLLDNIASFSADIKIPLPGFDEAAPDEILRSRENTYYGKEGLRAAVIRFLGNAVRGGAEELWLYSDQNMDWMTEDAGFRLSWMALMRECVMHGIRIRIVHNINRNTEEMINAINSWLPLYMSGMIESFYCTRQNDNRFSTTIFLCPGQACIWGVHTVGNEDKCLYRYDTDEKILAALKEDYKKLLEMSKQLVWIYNAPEEERNIYVGDSGITAVGGTLSLATMPESVINSMIARAGLDERTRNAVISEWETKRLFFNEILTGGVIHECIVMAKRSDLSGGAVAADIKAADLMYTQEEYAQHIKSVIALSENNSNYRFIALPEEPFTNIGIVASENAVLITRLLAPQTTFVFFHPSMCEAFSWYTNSLKEQYRQDKITLRRRLESYLN